MKISRTTLLYIGSFTIAFIGIGIIFRFITAPRFVDEVIIGNSAQSLQGKENIDEGETPDNPLIKKHGSIDYFIAQPASGEAVASPLTIVGSISGVWYFEGQFTVEIRNATGITLANATATALDEWMTEDLVRFKALITFDPEEEENGFLVLVKNNPSSLPQNDDSISIPIKFDTSHDFMSVNVYFGNSLLDPQSLDCSVVFPSTRSIPRTTDVGRASLEQLLLGTSDSEETYGYFSSIGDGVVLNSLEITDGIAYADFNEALQEGVGGSCRVLRIRSQIENTLKQFPTVTSVVISIEGKTDHILQP